MAILFGLINSDTFTQDIFGTICVDFISLSGIMIVILITLTTVFVSNGIFAKILGDIDSIYTYFTRFLLYYYNQVFYASVKFHKLMLLRWYVIALSHEL